MANPADKRFHQLTLAIQKAINAVETPVKEKHVRSTIIGTFHEQSAITYWMVVLRLPLQDNRIVSWKFCHVTHKLLREGHPACLDDSQRHIAMIENLGKLWVHLREGYGRLIHLYCNLLVTKLKFHARNPRFPGNMQVTADELDSIAENDVNNYFQLCVELFDYMDDILNLQAAVFESLGNARANSMTASGQCRLAALIPCAQDASPAYDAGVRLLFRLHAALPADTLAGHRERFRQQFKKLSSFYKHASSLQYYRNLLSLPVLPANPPNFLLQSDFGTYVTPVVSVPEPEPDEPDNIAALIDTSDTMSQATNSDFDVVDRAAPSPAPDPIVERDRLIDHLQSELKRMRSEVSQIIQERNTMLGSIREHCSHVESQLQSTKNELEQEKQKAEIVLAQAPEIKKKLTETEEKAKISDEKFQKLKGAYTQLREEHITLIRQKAEVDKVASSLRAAAAQHESAKAMLQQQLNDRMKDMELLQQSASSSEEIEAYKMEIANIRSDLEQSRQKEAELESLKAAMEALEIEHKTATTEQQEKILTISTELKEATESLEKLKQEVSEKDTELNKVKEELTGLRQKSGDEYRKAVEEKEAALKQVTQLTQQYQQEKEHLEARLLHTESERLNAECELQDLLQQNTILEADMAALKIQLEEANAEIKKKTSRLVGCASEVALAVTNEAMSSFENSNSQDANQLAAELAAKAFEDLARKSQIEGNEEVVAKSAILGAHSAAQLSAYVADVSSTATNMELADKLNNECRNMLNSVKRCLESLSTGTLERTACMDARGCVQGAGRAVQSAARPQTHSVDDELALMDQAIEDAAKQIEEMLAASRKDDSGVKLEVNEKILDACTTLMAAVKVLVQDARKLQNEIGDPKTRQKMYRKNPQWSEGLISAAKAVVFAAKLLVTSADEAAGASGRVEGVSAAAHEVAGSTAQLVAASRARAPPAAPALARLTAASRQVAAAAGAVVAAVRAASALVNDTEALDTSALSLTATRRLEMESKVRALELESALDAERAKLAALRRRHYQLAQQHENGNVTNGAE
ncbi:huntingtin-interacting protein 1-related protein isoform X2 [Aricia agestis]|uniref:huntingtin-interacting protein 1-related protein isoform X2 n=1 Tax=Aricia agestis TaxID=91739 RepID=UPI001C209223|nr:huntingtin-interacting protein 1-related protein isoform X2 [Aricia agestis]XP_041979254.1 huntingtin-interacting protein 1-related protein isoform X2 [Aricia agestis]XP_041979255.1 huntingtin-interacting protein 1-related protein isoform X2 [Aricia agestis]